MEFITSAKYELENERVFMRPLEIDDYVHLIYYTEYEQELFEYSISLMQGVKNLKNYINLTLEARERGVEYPFIVFDKQNGKYAGTTRFYDIQLQNKSLQLGYTWYGKDFHGTGLNRNCKFLLLQFAFETIGVERVEFRANNLNERSKAAMLGIGCTVEGVLRKNVIGANGFRRDTIILSILKEEWQNGIKDQLRIRL